jgi:small subunit ribosomal protein S17
VSEEDKNEQAEAPEAAESQAEEAADEQAEAPDAEEAPAEEAPDEQVEAPEAEESPAEEAPAEDAADEQIEAPAAAAPAEAAEPAEELTPKQRRKLGRARQSGESRPQRTPEERAAERAELRRAKAAERRRERARTRSAHQPGEGTAAAERRPGSKKVRQGTVVSSKADKTITVQIEVVRRHPVYEKVVRRSATIHAHDETNEANSGDVVRVVESRPLSRTKRWRLVEVLERAR